MKRGISLIVLVITIIVMIILAATIIISISNSGIISKANKAVNDTNISTIKEASALKYANVKLKVKEQGEVALAGKTVGEYVEQELVSDGTITSNNDYVFGENGDAYQIPNNDIANKADYRAMNGKLYYLGTDIDKRIYLKNNTDVSIEYILITPDMDSDGDGYITFSEAGFLGDVKSISEITTETYTYGSADKTSLLSTDDLTLRTGAILYAGTSSTNVLGVVVIPGDVYFWGTINDLNVYTYLQEKMSTGISATAFNSKYKSDYLYMAPDIYKLLLDIDLNNKVEQKEVKLLYYLSREILLATGYIDKKLNQISSYTGGSAELKTWFSDSFNIDTVVDKIPTKNIRKY